ncbi:hypothetical protein [Streptomyces sp. NPDC088789]|uniref:hypothetical protein n=1 Tax=Streptomyces sp. NPDC088789 TaxID=3365899 RepID=UPI003825E30E
MRLVPAALTLTAFTALTSLTAVTPLAAAPAQAAAPTPAPGCAASDGRDFPLRTRVHGGPDTYLAGGGFGTWYVDVTNTTDRTCSGIYPVVVLVDEQRELTAAQPRLEFYEGRRPHPVRFESTDEDELVGVFEAGKFAGFSVAPGRTTRVKVRLSLTSDAVANEITAAAAVVQRQDDDGDWVGESNDYRFTVVRTGPDETASRPESGTEPRSDTADGTDPDSGTDPGTDSGSGTHPGSGTLAPTPSPDRPTTLAEELARTGLGSPNQALGLTLALLASGVALLLARRRRR